MLLKQQQLSSLFFIPYSHDILLDFFAFEHILPRSGQGSIDPLANSFEIFTSTKIFPIVPLVFPNEIFATTSNS